MQDIMDVVLSRSVGEYPQDLQLCSLDGLVAYRMQFEQQDTTRLNLCHCMYGVDLRAIGVQWNGDALPLNFFTVVTNGYVSSAPKSLWGPLYHQQRFETSTIASTNGGHVPQGHVS